MITETSMLYLYVETPLHAGVGSGLSSIDLPIQRERATQYPMIQGTGIKGKLRTAASDAASSDDKKVSSVWKDDTLGNVVDIVFGPETNGVEYAGSLIAGDARLLLFPVRSLNGVFAYTTSINILSRFLRDNSRGGKSQIPWPELPTMEEHVALVPTINRVTTDQTLVLEEFSFDTKPLLAVTKIGAWLAENAFPQLPEYTYWRQKVQDSLVILPDDDFRDFVVNATEVITRIRINRESKTVKGGALWTEEHLPTDTLLYVPIYATNARKLNDAREPVLPASEILKKAKTLEQSQQGYVQLGGDETVGRGFVRMHWR